MDILLVIVALINIISIIFLIISLMRLRIYLRQVTLEESKYTLIFGFIDLKIYIYSYILFTLLYGAFLWIIIL